MTKQYTYEQYEAKGQYVVLSPEGFDLLGEWVGLEEAQSIVKWENAILELLSNKDLLVIAEQYKEAGESSEDWLDDLLHDAANSVHLRALKRRPSYLHSFYAAYQRKEAERAIHLAKRVAELEAFNALDHTAIKYTIANMLEAPVTVAQVEEVYKLLFKYNELDNVKEWASNPMFLSECISHIISEL